MQENRLLHHHHLHPGRFLVLYGVILAHCAKEVFQENPLPQQKRNVLFGVWQGNQPSTQCHKTCNPLSLALSFGYICIIIYECSSVHFLLAYLHVYTDLLCLLLVFFLSLLCFWVLMLCSVAMVT